MNYISDVLFWISNGLLVPVVVLLILFFLRSLLLIGNFFGQYLQIRKVDRLFMTKVEALTPATVGNLRASLPANTKSPLLNCLAGMLDTTKDRAHRQLLLSDYEIAADKDLGTSKTLSKMGPMLGLMGTLIPGLQHAGGLRHDRRGPVLGRDRLHHPAGQAALVHSRPEPAGVRVGGAGRMRRCAGSGNQDRGGSAMKRRRLLGGDEENDPMSVVGNLFDVAMVFAVALMVALVTRYNMTEMLSPEDFTMVKNPGKEDMEIIVKQGQNIDRYTPSEDQSKSGQRGKRVGIAYELENGEIIYVPE